VWPAELCATDQLPVQLWPCNPGLAGQTPLIGNPEAGEPTGPREKRGARAGQPRRQYCWWVTFPFPYDQTIQRLQLKTPADFDRDSFSKLCVEAFAHGGWEVQETANFLELHLRTDANGDRLPHLNCLLRVGSQCTWMTPAAYLRSKGVRVDFADHIATWYDGIVYGRVWSAHKPVEELDKEPTQWAKNGCPTPFNEVLPAKWHSERGRQPKMSHLQVYDILTSKGISESEAAWALATERAEGGDRGLLAFFLEHKDVDGFVAKVRTAGESKETKRRRERGRIGLLQDAAQQPCSCSVPGQWRTLATETLDKNGVRDEFCKAVYSALEKGRQKKQNIFILGPTNAAKSFCMDPLEVIYRAYKQPDSGTHQLETVLDKEIMYLNDFEWEPKESWMRWAYFKNFLEGHTVEVARPKNRGGNVTLKKDLLVLGTCGKRIELFLQDKSNRIVPHDKENRQMESRMHYILMPQEIDEDAIVHGVKPCARCGAELYLTGKP
jgi:hypothetical protein